MNLKEIILDNRNLIYSVIHRFKGSDYNELFQVGCLGLIKAYHSFKGEYNVKFTTYAYQYIVGEIYKFINENRSIHMSLENTRLLASLKKAEERLTNHLGKSPTDEELASFLEIDLYKLYELRNISQVESLDYEYDNNNMYDFIQKEEISKDDLIDLRNALDSLTEEEKKFIKQRFYDNITQSEMASIYHTNQVKISRDEKKILLKLKAKMI